MSDETTTHIENSLKAPSILHTSLNISKVTAARLAILFYVLLALLSPLGLLLPPQWIDEGDAAGTVENIQDNDTLFRVAIVLNIFGQTCFLLVGIAFYELYKDVNRFQAKLLLAFVAVSVPITIGMEVFHLGALHLVGDAEYLGNLNNAEINAQVVFMMSMYEFGIHIVSIFWGLWLIPLGYLSYKSEYLPKVLGILLIINGVSYVLDVINWIVFSQEVEMINTVLLIGAAIGELPTILWLLIMGFNLPVRRVRLWG